MNEEESQRDEKFGEKQNVVEIAIGNEPRHRRGSIAQYFVPWTLYWAAVVHVIVGIGLLADPVSVARVAVLVGLDAFLEMGVPPTIFAVVLLAASAMGLLALVQEGSNHPSRKTVLVLLFPQYLLVTMGFVTDGLVLIDGSYRGVDFPFWQGVIGFAPVMVIAIFHNAQVIERYFLKWAYRR